MEVSYRTDRNILYIAIEGRVDASNAALAEEKIFEIKGANPDKHTVIDADKLELFNSALNAANAAKTSRSQTEINNAVAGLNAALNAVKDIDNSALVDAIEAAKALDEFDYTEADWADILAAIETAEGFLTSRNQTAVNNATTALTELVEGKTPLDRSELETAIADIDGAPNNGYSDETWAALQTAIANAKQVLAASRDQAVINAATSALNAAVAALAAPDYTDLEAAIEIVEALNETDYTEEDWADILAAIETAKGYLTSNSQEAIDAAITALEAAVNAKTPIDRSALQSAIDAAKALTETDYTAETWADLVAAIADAEAKLASRVQADIDEAVAALNAVVSALEEVAPEEPKEDDDALDFTALNASIAAAEALKEDDYTATSWAAMRAALVNAKKALSSANSQEDIDAAKKALDDAVAALKADSGDDNRDDTPDDKPDDEDDDDGKKEKKGCGSAIAASAVVLTTVLALGLGFKKKED